MTRDIRRTLLTLLWLPVLLISCTSPKWQMQAPCPGSSNEEIISALTALVAQEGMDIDIVNSGLGILQASMVGETKWFTSDHTNHWNFNVRNDTIFAFAKMVKHSAERSLKESSVTTTSTAQETYYSTENADSEADWFWNVYNGITSLCPDQTIIFVEK